jgi:hypothetical protein
MNNKIIGIFVFMLFSTTIVSATNLNLNENIQMTISEVDVPLWKIGDSWTYNEKYKEISYNKNGDISYQWFRNCTTSYIVTADTDDSYTLKVSSNNYEGGLKYGLLQLKFTRFMKFIEELECRKTDLGYISEYHQEKGLAFLSLGNIRLSIPTQYSQIYDALFTPASIYLPFPFTVGENGIIPSCSETGHEKTGLYWGLIKFIDSDFNLNYPTQDYNCEMAQITVPIGSYNTYNISIDEHFGSLHNYSWVYYVPEIGYYVKRVVHWEASGFLPIRDFKCELVSTTHKPTISQL